MGELADWGEACAKVAKVLDPLPMNEQLRVLAAACAMLGDAEYARAFLDRLEHVTELGKAVVAWGEAMRGMLIRSVDQKEGT